MKVRLAMVSSLDGRTTFGRYLVSEWASREDQLLFEKLRKAHDVIIMGRSTFLKNRSLIKPDAQTLRVVMTKKPADLQKYAVRGQLEVTAKSPRALLNFLERKGYKKALIASGAKLNQAFFKAGLIDEIHLTTEPLIFGSGKGITDKLDKAVNLKLRKVRRLNPRGTLYLIYEVVR